MKRKLAVAILAVAGLVAPILFAAGESSTPPAGVSIEQKLNALQQQMVELQAAMNKLNSMMGSGNMMQSMRDKGGMMDKSGMMDKDGMGHMMGGMDPEAMKRHCQSMMGGKAKPNE